MTHKKAPLSQGSLITNYELLITNYATVTSGHKYTS